MKTKRLSAVIVLSVLIATVCESLAVLAEEDLNVLPIQTEGAPTLKMLYRNLERRAQAAFDRREAMYEKLKTNEQIQEYQARLHEFFFQQLGRLPEKSPLNPRIAGTVNGDGYRGICSSPSSWQPVA